MLKCSTMSFKQQSSQYGSNDLIMLNNSALASPSRNSLLVFVKVNMASKTHSDGQKLALLPSLECYHTNEGIDEFKPITYVQAS